MKVFVILACAIVGIYGQAASNPCAGQKYGAYLPDPTDCGFYYHCVSSTDFRRPCPAGLEFNPVLNVCDWPLAAGCSGGVGSVVTPSPVPTAPCKSTAPETLSIAGNCASYIYCYLGYPYTVICDAGKLYSAPDHACITATVCPGDGSVVTPPVTCPGNGTVVTPPATSYTCPSSSPSTAPYTGDTSKYYYCYNGVAYIVQCAGTQKYNQSGNNCA